ncbi:SIR2 family protein [Nitratireductor aquibiodomus]|uniref:SIR2 family protein n=1 Tax=Nitratireductor aquibiodomus TaxID=204799 RepID=UPI0019D3EA24|nr:SIR2 family protein [Nitratireductor aquibiodomus]MBN7763371.1 SIR2 family protein [Nitratireductor aquibiodomus]
MLDLLARDIRDRKVILFVGSGLSKPLGLPSWEELIKHMAEELGFDPDILVGPSADYLQVAEFYKLRKGSIGDLRSWMDRNWSVRDEQLRESKVHKQIVDLEFPLIYTTNYDNNLERSFELHGKDVAKIASVVDIAEAQADRPHVVKFHGDFSDDNSLVITEADYFERLEFESPLDLRLRADVLGRSILFVGYSLKDLNLRLLLYKLKRTWDSTAYAKKRPRSFIFLVRPDAVQEEVLDSRGVSPIVSDALDPEDALPEFFDRLLDMVCRTG